MTDDDAIREGHIKIRVKGASTAEFVPNITHQKFDLPHDTSVDSLRFVLSSRRSDTAT